jgi:hypothetical protein
MDHRDPARHSTTRRAPAAGSARQVFTFCIKGDSVTRATVTIHARDLDVAWSRLRALFPDADLNETVVQPADRH